MGLDAIDLEFVRSLVQRTSAVVLAHEKSYLVEDRLRMVANQEGVASVADLLLRLRASTSLHQKVVEAMTVNETYFFRDQAPFDALRSIVLPTLVRERAGERQLRIWSAAASTGQEAFSIALTFREHFRHLTDWRLRILASDLSSHVLGRARRGVYTSTEVSRGLSPDLLQRYFRREGEDWELDADVRRMVDFQSINLAAPLPSLPEMDVIFLRNVLIYFDLPTRKAVLTGMLRILRPGGYLFLGAAETPLPLEDRFQRIEFERANCYRYREPIRSWASVMAR